MNCKNTDPIPIQEVNGKRVEIKDHVKCLGDIFNRKATYIDLVDDRVRRGTVCTVNSMALCNDAQMGKYSILSLILLYKTVFLKTVIHNSETWNNLSKNDISRLSTAQNKYLKWMLHTSKGTCTSFTLLELGLLPISQEIDLNKLNYLHHILNLPSDDPVIQVYREQKQYTSEPNWYNEVKQLLCFYGLDYEEDSIKLMSKQQWNALTKQAVRSWSVTSLYDECKSKSKTANIPMYTELSQQQYFQELTPSRARKYFQIRAQVYDIKPNRSYLYGDDKVCRLCKNSDETIDHLVNRCEVITRNSTTITSIYNISESSLLLDRIEQFEKKVKDIEDSTTDNI